MFKQYREIDKGRSGAGELKATLWKFVIYNSVTLDFIHYLHLFQLWVYCYGIIPA